MKGHIPQSVFVVFMLLSGTGCPRDFNEEWFPYFFLGDPDAVEDFIKTHCREYEFTDDRGLIVMATVELFEVNVRNYKDYLLASPHPGGHHAAHPRRGAPDLPLQGPRAITGSFADRVYPGNVSQCGV